MELVSNFKENSLRILWLYDVKKLLGIYITHLSVSILNVITLTLIWVGFLGVRFLGSKIMLET